MDSSNISQSISQHKFSKHGVELIVTRESQNYVEISIKNQNYNKQKQSLQRWLVVLLLIYLTSASLFTIKLPIMFHVISLAFFICSLVQLVYLIDQEVLKIAEDLGIEKLTFYSYGRRNRSFVPNNRIYKVIINEVIYFVRIALNIKLNLINLRSCQQNRIIYVLQLLTKGDVLSNSVTVLFDVSSIKYLLS